MPVTGRFQVVAEPGDEIEHREQSEKSGQDGWAARLGTENGFFVSSIVDESIIRP
jgi:hypothetical protein